MAQHPTLNNYRHHVLNKFQVNNSLFLNLPFDAVYQTGVLLPFLSHACEQGYQAGLSPQQIMQRFFQQQGKLDAEEQQLNLLFKCVQYIERQIVLFDAVEEAAFAHTHELDGPGSLTHLASRAAQTERSAALQDILSEHRVRVVLTAHPTQFYPGPVLGIMTDLSQAIQANDFATTEALLQQLGQTPLFSQSKPTPFDEAVSLIWYLENVFYDTVKAIIKRISQHIYPNQALPDNAFIELGFWPGGDRDGNPFVDASTTLKVADRLHRSVLKCYHRDLRELKKRLTFRGVIQRVEALEKSLYQAAYLTDQTHDLTAAQLVDELQAILALINERHHGLYADLVHGLINQIKCFGLYFATLDVRQDSRIHHQVMLGIARDTMALPAAYQDLAPAAQAAALAAIEQTVAPDQLSTAVAQDTVASIQAMQQIQAQNGEFGANRYIISNCQSALNVLEVLALFRLAGWPQPSADVVPLFETIEDLAQAPGIMAQLLQDEGYRQHLRRRQQRQTIMLGFSDGTKDGGYLAANWAIVQAKEALSEVFEEAGIQVVFFDGRGGPPARGGGATHKFYATQSPAIANHATQLTIQGQTISANFGHPLSAQHNLEQLLSAGLSSRLFPAKTGWDSASRQQLQQLAELSLDHYQRFKQHPQFLPYLERVSTLKYYGMTNIGSRPTKRNPGEGLRFEDLRAIPFVGAWSQLKQNVLGYYGVGHACAELTQSEGPAALAQLYQQSGYFKALVDNSLMSIAKSFMPLTAYLQADPEFGTFWSVINDEFEQSQQQLLVIAGVNEPLADQPMRQWSIREREAIVLPLLTIQQHALQRIKQLQAKAEPQADLLAAYEKLVTRSLYGNINAARNAV
ncbi:phosphoenolpyruvate carboxylase [Marinicella meishanensis]|uniref:phosphoenolpyruvate carboxylase n=1 Tax=Marinicella meishanensis TaxID=2873263 RepID=UPI001CBB5037|nr:phosphoenolpyruvate carboxylase [Marinicella sp. NBU2979]